MPTAWTDEEYAEVAEALLWPLSRTAILTMGPTPAYYFGRDLDARLQQLSPISKARALELARQVRALVDRRTEQAMGGAGGCGGGNLAVTQVGDIRFDRSLPLKLADDALADVRQRLAALVDFFINPNAVGAARGGVNGTWCP